MHETQFVSASILPRDRRAHQFRLVMPAKVFKAIREPSVASYELSGRSLRVYPSESGRVVTRTQSGQGIMRMGLLKSSEAHSSERCPVRVYEGELFVKLPEAMAETLEEAWGV